MPDPDTRHPPASPATPAGGRRVAYGLSRFPTSTETFVVREMNALVDNFGDIEIPELLALFPAGNPFLHPSAERWMELLRRPSPREAATATLWWTLRRPRSLLAAIGTVLRRCRRSPDILLRSLATVPLAAAHARRLVQGEPVEHLHVHYASYPALAAWLIHRLAGVPYSFTAHAYDLFVDQSMLEPKIAEAEFVVTISEYNRRFLARYSGDELTPVHVIHCGVDPASYPFRPRRIPAEGPVRAICVAGLEEKKGHAVLLEALAFGGPALERLSVDLVGDGELREELEQRAAGLGLRERVHFQGRLGERQVAELLEEADLFVLPSIVAPNGQMEGLPVALMEALAVGLVAVSTRLSGIPELIVDGETGFLAEPGDATSLADTLTRALSGERIDAALGRSRIESEFDINRSAARMHGLLTAAGTDPIP